MVNKSLPETVKRLEGPRPFPAMTKLFSIEPREHPLSANSPWPSSAPAQGGRRPPCTFPFAVQFQRAIQERAIPTQRGKKSSGPRRLFAIILNPIKLSVFPNTANLETGLLKSKPAWPWSCFWVCVPSAAADLTDMQDTLSTLVDAAPRAGS